MVLTTEQLQLAVATVAERFVVTGFTATQKLFLRSSDGKFDWRNACAFMGAIAEWLLLGFPTSTPPVISRTKFYCVRRFLYTDGFAHCKISIDQYKFLVSTIIFLIRKNRQLERFIKSVVPPKRCCSAMSSRILRPRTILLTFIAGQVIF